jgi:hypothetical protein
MVHKDHTNPVFDVWIDDIKHTGLVFAYKYENGGIKKLFLKLQNPKNGAIYSNAKIIIIDKYKFGISGLARLREETPGNSEIIYLEFYVSSFKTILYNKKNKTMKNHNFRPADGCWNCLHLLKYNDNGYPKTHCKWMIPSRALPGVPEVISTRNAICDRYVRIRKEKK